MTGAADRPASTPGAPASRARAPASAAGTARRKAAPPAASNDPVPARRARVPEHLGPSPHEEAVTDFEQSLICAAEAFYRFIGLLLGPEGRRHNLAGPDNVILQQLVAAPEPRGVTELARFANRDDIANIQYSLRKLIQAGLVEKAPGSTNRDTRYGVTPRGRELTEAFLAIRRELLMKPSAEIRDFDAQLRTAAQAMSLVTSLYDHGTRKITARDMLRPVGS
jgi:predicted MarR family transcription regulator